MDRTGRPGSAQKARKLSGGQRAQLALVIAAAKRPELLLLDEPVAALDPLARRHFLQGLMELTAEQGMSIVMSSHLVADLERVCDYLIVLVDSRVQVAGDGDDLFATHHRLVGHRRDSADLGVWRALVEQSHTDVQSTLVVRSGRAISTSPPSRPSTCCPPWWASSGVRRWCPGYALLAFVMGVTTGLLLQWRDRHRRA